MHKIYIDRIINSNDSKKMKELENIMVDTITYLKTLDPEEYEDIECELYEISEGKVLNEEKAKYIIENMKPYGMKWQLSETEQIRKENGLTNIRPVDFWIVMNSAYNDFHDNWLGNDLTQYVKYTEDFINDADANEAKVYLYFTCIPKK